MSVLETNPFPPGTSPFHVKGLAYRHMLDYVDREVSGGRAAVIAELADDKMQTFMSQTFLPGTWYDTLPTALFFQTAARLARQPLLELTRKMAREAASKDINGIHRFMLKMASPELVMERIPRAAKQYFDFVTSE